MAYYYADVSSTPHPTLAGHMLVRSVRRRTHPWPDGSLTAITEAEYHALRAAAEWTDGQREAAGSVPVGPYFDPSARTVAQIEDTRRRLRFRVGGTTLDRLATTRGAPTVLTVEALTARGAVDVTDTGRAVLRSPELGDVEVALVAGVGTVDVDTRAAREFRFWRSTATRLEGMERPDSAFRVTVT